MIAPTPSGTRDVLPDEMRELRAITESVRGVFETMGYGEIATPALEYEAVLVRGDASAGEPAYRLFDESGNVLVLRSEYDDGDILVPGGQKLMVARDAGDYQSKVEDGPWPAFPADLTSIAVVAATQARGTVLVFEKMFESRLFFFDNLVSMGARIIL